MTLTDTGPLVALLDPTDRAHNRCVSALDELRKPLLTSLPVLVEAAHLLGLKKGWPGQDPVFRMIAEGDLVVAPFNPELIREIENLMRQYQDAPMDFADASIVLLAHERGLRQVFTVDSHFHAYRLPNRRSLQVIPGD